MLLRKLAIFLAVVLALGGGGLAFAAFSAAPAPSDILTRAVTTLENAQSGHAVLQIQGKNSNKSGSATVEVWASKLTDGSGNYAFRAQVLSTTVPEAQGAVAVSDGKTFWVYTPYDNTVHTGPVAQLDQNQSPQQIVQQILDASTPTLVDTESVDGHSTYKLQLVPNPNKVPAAAAGATGLVWIDTSSWLTWQASFNAGSMGQGQVTATTLELNVSIPSSRYQFQVPSGAKVVQEQPPQHLTLSDAIKTAGFKVLTPSYVPSGAKLVDVLKAGNAIVLRYEASQGSFDIAENTGEKANPAGMSGQSVQVRGVTGTVFASKDGSHLLLTWIENRRGYSVSGALSQQDALKVAGSLQ